jgi:hypothetical protein
MPLHLLSKKSWNVWNADNISRVDRDIARGEAIEAEQEQVLREYDSLRQLAILRGEAPPTPPRILSTEEIEQKVRDEARGERSADAEGRGAARKRRKLKGEDETDMELRLAKEAAEERYGESEKKERGLREKRKKIDAPITDPNGHINLFPIDPRDLAKQKNAEAEAEKAKKNKEFEDQYTMRFSNAAGRDGLKEKPWYANQEDKRKPQERDDEDATLTYMEYKNLWGKPDPKRKDRELTRASASDPMAVMQKAQSQLKRSEKDKQAWAKQKAKELGQVKEDMKRSERDHRHRRRHRRSDEQYEDNFRDNRSRFNHKTSTVEPVYKREDSDRRERGHRSSRHSRSQDKDYHVNHEIDNLDEAKKYQEPKDKNCLPPERFEQNRREHWSPNRNEKNRKDRNSRPSQTYNGRDKQARNPSRPERDQERKYNNDRHHPSRIPDINNLEPLSLDAPLPHP